MRRITLASCVLATSLSLAAQSPLTTTFANNNGGAVGGAVYFDLNPAFALNVTGIDVNLSTAAATAGSIDIYTCATTYVGNEANMAAWTMIGTGTVTSNGAGTPSVVTLAANIQLLPGANGYAYVGIGHSFSYTNGTGANQSYSTTELTLDAGAAANIAFNGTPFTPRVVNTSIYYAPAGGNFASKTPFGEGCYDSPRMVYEQIAENTSPIDLIGTAWTMIYTPSANGGNYIIIPGGPAYDAATAAANGVDLLTSAPTSSSSTGTWDDGSIVQTLPAAFASGFPFPGPGGGGNTADITINSNGKIYLGNTTDGSFDTNGANYGVIARFSGAIATTTLPQLAPFNVDLDPTVGGNMWYEAASPAGGVRITWANIANWQDPAGPPAVACDIQMELTPSGQVTMAFGPSLGNGGSAANAAIIGFSAGNGETVSDPVDWDTLSAYVTGDGATPLTIDGDARPVINTAVNVTVDNIPAASPLAAVIYGLAKFDPGMSLTPFGMDGCFQYTDFGAVALYIAPGSSVTNVFTIPNDPGLSGVHIITQGAAYNPAAINNATGAITSNGVDLGLDIN